MSSTADKYNKLSYQRDTENFSRFNPGNEKQLIWPKDLLDQADNQGFVVMFELNAPKNHNKNYDIQTVQNRGRTIASLSHEVDMQTQKGGAGGTPQSIKDKQKLIDPIYQKTDLSVVLPMPDQIDSLYNIVWENTEFGALMRLLDLKNTISKDENGNIASAMNQIKESMTRSVTGIVDSVAHSANLTQMVNYISALSQNPYQEILFRSVSNRFIPMFWTLVPRSYEEAIVIRNIIHRMKWAMHPELWDENNPDNYAYLRSPFTFDISFIDVSSSKRNEWVWKIGTCALTNLMINGTPMGEFSVLRDGPFTAITLECSFVELVTLNKNHFKQPDETY